MKYVEVVLPIPLDKKFHYRIPESLIGKILPGMRVKVPFGKRFSIGYCVGFVPESQIATTWIKDIISPEDSEVLIDEKMFTLTRWIADYYLCSWGMVLRAAFPCSVRLGKKTTRKDRKKQEDAPWLYGEVAKTQPFTPTAEQEIAIGRIKEALQKGIFTPFLLHGVTGSGKTEVYLVTIAEAIRMGKQAIVLVPEISLTPQTVHKFRERFDKVAILHSKLTPAQRAKQWQLIRSGEAEVIIGTRSAIFAPTKNLGMIVIDDEHESSYKQESTPRYHVREVALKRAEIENAVVIFGSATPSLESYYRSLTGELQRLVLSKRIFNRPLPSVEIIDINARGLQESPIISPKLESAIRQTLSEGGQVILFLNRRGYVTFITCPKCGFIQRCKRCQVASTYHKQTNKIKCHHCDKEEEFSFQCPECGYPRLKLLGMGAEKVESFIKEIFGAYDIRRVDSDALRYQESATQVLKALWIGATDILVGTQMVAKGLDFPKVTLVGVISGDTVLALKDFRSAERTFQLIAQVAGRAGRGPKGGRVILQTVNPGHYSIRYAGQHDYESFVREELAFRESLFYPPYSWLLRILLEGRNQEKVMTYSKKLATLIEPELLRLQGGELLGPAPAPIAKIRARFRWHLVIKAKSPQIIRHIYQTFHSELTNRKYGVNITLDVDPLNLL